MSRINSLKAKFLLVLIPLFVVSFGVLAGISYYVTHGEVRQRSQG